MCHPSVCTERDETLMQRGSPVRARNFGFPTGSCTVDCSTIRDHCRYKLTESNFSNSPSPPPLSLFRPRRRHARHPPTAVHLPAFLHRPRFPNSISRCSRGKRPGESENQVERSGVARRLPSLEHPSGKASPRTLNPSSSTVASEGRP